MKKASVIIPVYNSERYIENCLKSLLNQDYQNIEIIVVNDGSTDSSEKIIKEYSKKKSLVKYIYQDNFGAPSARNKGLSKATGDYIIFFDSDDFVEKNFISKMVEKIEEGNDLVICGSDEIDMNSHFLQKKRTDLKYKFKDFKYEKFFYDPYPGNKIFRKSIIDKYGIRFDNVRIGQDLNFYLKYVCHIENYKYIDDILSHYRIVNTGISRLKNFNLFDIVNSLNFSFKHMKEYNVENAEQIINTIKLSCYTSQLSKVRSYSYFKKKVVSKFFNYQLFVLHGDYVITTKYVILLKIKRICWTICSFI